LKSRIFVTTLFVNDAAREFLEILLVSVENFGDWHTFVESKSQSRIHLCGRQPVSANISLVNSTYNRHHTRSNLIPSLELIPYCCPFATIAHPPFTTGTCRLSIPIQVVRKRLFDPVWVPVNLKTVYDWLITVSNLVHSPTGVNRLGRRLRPALFQYLWIFCCHVFLVEEQATCLVPAFLRLSQWSPRRI